MPTVKNSKLANKLGIDVDQASEWSVDMSQFGSYTTDEFAKADWDDGAFEGEARDVSIQRQTDRGTDIKLLGLDYQRVQAILRGFQKRFDPNGENAKRRELRQVTIRNWVIITKLASSWTILFTLVKLFVGALDSSGFLLVNAIFSVTMAWSKNYIVDGYVRAERFNRNFSVRHQELYRCQIAGALCVIVSCIYMWFGAGILNKDFGAGVEYSTLTGLGMTAIAIGEIFLALKGVFNCQTAGQYVLRCLKMLNVCTSFGAAALANIAILSIFIKGGQDLRENGIMVLVCGAISLVIGLFLLSIQAKHGDREWVD